MDTKDYRSRIKNDGFILKWTIVLIIIASASKVLGFIREATIAYVFGASFQTDAYFVAILLPGMIFTDFNEAFNRAFISVYGSLRKDPDSNVFVNSSGLLLLLFLSVLFVIILVFAPLLARIMAPGFSGETLQLTILLMRIVIGSLFFIGLSGVISGYLRANHLFLGAALTGLPLNIVIIMGALLWGVKYGIVSFAYVTVAGYFFSLLILIPWLIGTDYTLKSGIDLQNRGVRELKFLLPPLIFAGAASEIKALIDRMFASLLPVGGVSALNYAARVRDIPVSILIVSFATVLFPTMVDLFAEKNMEKFKETLLQGMRIVIFLMMPLVALTYILSQPIIRFIYQRGAFTAADTTITAAILLFFSFGMVGDALNHILNRAYFAIKDLRTPMRITIFLAVLNLFLNAVLIGPFKHVGIAISTSICFLTGATLSFYYLHKRLELGRLDSLAKTVLKSIAGSALMGLLIRQVADTWQKFWLPQAFSDQFIQLATLGLCGLVLYVFLMWLMRADEIALIPELIVSVKNKYLMGRKSN